MGLPARDLTDDDYNIEPDIRPNLHLIEGSNENTPDRANLKEIHKSESNPESLKTGSINDQEEAGFYGSGDKWKTGVTALNTATGGRFKFILNKANFKNNKWPTIVTLVIMLFAIVGISMVSFASLGIVQMEKSLTSMLDDSAHPLRARTRKVMANKFRNSFALSSDGKCNIKCKMGSINEKTLKKFKDQGFEIDAEKGTGAFSDRYILKSVTFPNNGEGPQQPIKTGDEFAKAMQNTSKASSFNKVLNTKTAFFNNNKFVSALKTKFNINKQSDLTAKLKDAVKDKSTATKDKVKASIRSALGLPELDPKAPKKTAAEKIKENPKYKAALAFANESKAMKSYNKSTMLFEKICGLYDISRGLNYTAKASKIAAFTGFAMIFLSYSNKLMSGEETEPEVADTVGSLITETDSTGNTMLSSDAYRAYTFNDPMTLSEENKKYSMANSTALIETTGKILAAVGLGGMVGYKFYHVVCNLVGNPAAGILDNAVACPVETEAAVLAAAPSGGASVLALALICTLKKEAFDIVISVAIATVLSFIIKEMASTELPPIDESLVGNAGGYALSSGTAQILGGKSASYGLTPGNYEQIKTFQEQTASLKQEEEDIAKYDGDKNPLDIYNQYSFLGSIVQNSNISSLANNRSLSSFIGSLLSFLPKSLASLSNNTYAESNNKASLYKDKCDDAGLEEIGVDGDPLCNVGYFMTEAEMSADVEPATQYMIDKGYIIEETGEVKKDTKPNDYQLYLENCADRVDPLGSTSTQVGDGDIWDLELYAWKIGKKCTESNEKMSNFHIYTMDKIINETANDEEPKATSTTTSPPAGDTTIDKAKLYEDSTGVPCAAGTTDSGTAVGYHDKVAVNIKLCTIPGATEVTGRNGTEEEAIKVNSRVSGAWLALINAVNTAKVAGTPFHALDSFRTNDEQTFEFVNAGSPTDGSVAEPGTSNHQMGLAIDIHLTSISIDSSGQPTGKEWSLDPGADALHDWLVANAGTYGITELLAVNGKRAESWHWQVVSE